MIAAPYVLLLLLWTALGGMGAHSPHHPAIFPLVIAVHVAFGLRIRWRGVRDFKAGLRIFLDLACLAFPLTAALWFATGIAARLRAVARENEHDPALHRALWAANESWRRLGFLGVIGGVFWLAAVFDVFENHRRLSGQSFHPWLDPLRLPFFFTSSGSLMRLGLLPVTLFFAFVLLRSLRLLRWAERRVQTPTAS